MTSTTPSIPLFSDLTDCAICRGSSVMITSPHQLRCGHTFHYACIYHWYRSLKTRGYAQPRRCPICDTDGGYLPPHPDFRTYRSINEIDMTSSYSQDLGHGLWNYCTALIQSRTSPRYGQPCHQPCGNQPLCPRHRRTPAHR